MQRTAVPGAGGRSSLGVWTLRLAEAAAAPRVHRGSQSAFPAQRMGAQAMFAFGAVACRALGRVSLPSPDFARLISCASQAVQFLPGVSALTQEFQPNPILLRRDEGEVNSRSSPQTDD